MMYKKDDIIRNQEDQINSITRNPITYLETPIAHIFPSVVIVKNTTKEESSKT